MYLRVIFALCVMVLAHPALARPYEGCSPRETVIIDAALRDAKPLALKAAVAVGDTPHYQRWFGNFSPANAEEVRASFKAIVTAIRGGRMTVQCDAVGDDGCTQGEFAWVLSDQPYMIHVCPSFFGLQSMAEFRPDAVQSLNGTREGTLIHEISHFVHLAATEDHCYSRDLCAQMARRDPKRAIENADSFQYFAEDVVFFARQPITGKPPPAPRPPR